MSSTRIKLDQIKELYALPDDGKVYGITKTVSGIHTAEAGSGGRYIPSQILIGSPSMVVPRGTAGAIDPDYIANTVEDLPEASTLDMFAITAAPAPFDGHIEIYKSTVNPDELGYLWNPEITTPCPNSALFEQLSTTAPMYYFVSEFFPYTGNADDYNALNNKPVLNVTYLPDTPTAGNLYKLPNGDLYAAVQNGAAVECVRMSKVYVIENDISKDLPTVLAGDRITSVKFDMTQTPSGDYWSIRMGVSLLGIITWNSGTLYVGQSSAQAYHDGAWDTSTGTVDGNYLNIPVDFVVAEKTGIIPSGLGAAQVPTETVYDNAELYQLLEQKLDISKVIAPDDNAAAGTAADAADTSAALKDKATTYAVDRKVSQYVTGYIRQWNYNVMRPVATEVPYVGTTVIFMMRKWADAVDITPGVHPDGYVGDLLVHITKLPGTMYRAIGYDTATGITYNTTYSNTDATITWIAAGAAATVPTITGIRSDASTMTIKGINFPVSANRQVIAMDNSGNYSAISSVTWTDTTVASFMLSALPSGAVSVFVGEYDGTSYTNLSNGWALSASEGKPTVTGLFPGGSNYWYLTGWNFDKINSGNAYVGVIDTTGYISYQPASYSGSYMQTLSFSAPSSPSNPIMSAFACEYDNGNYIKQSNGYPFPASGGGDTVLITGSYESSGYRYLTGDKITSNLGSNGWEVFYVSSSGSVNHIYGSWNNGSVYFNASALPSDTISVFIAQYDGSTAPYYKNASNGLTIGGSAGGGNGKYVYNGTMSSVFSSWSTDASAGIEYGYTGSPSGYYVYNAKYDYSQGGSSQSSVIMSGLKAGDEIKFTDGTVVVTNNGSGYMYVNKL